MILLELPRPLKSRLNQGHPWVYRNQLASPVDLPSGTWVRVRCDGFSAYGLWDRESAIAVRIFSRHQVPDADWVACRVSEAWETRAPVRVGSSTAFRWVYGESDGLPGIVVDLYGKYAVVQTHVKGVETLLSWVGEALHAHTRIEGIVLRPVDGQPRAFWGRLPPHDLTVEENGLLFCAELFAGQKTGLYLDQRENRLALSTWCHGQTMLDCFCYTGGFGLYALRAGARRITACDSAPAAIEAAQRNLVLNGFDPAQHTFVAEDCFRLLQQYADGGRRFDIIVLDPPSLAHDRQTRHSAERAYVKLNRLALACVTPGGLLASASCTTQISPQVFQWALAEAAAQAGRRLLTIHDAGQAADHPVPPHFPEARYLKFVVSRVLDRA